MNCAGCQMTLVVGDRYIQATASEFMRDEGAAELDDLMASVLGSGQGNKLVYCEDCTQDGGDWRLETVYGDEDQ